MNKLKTDLCLFVCYFLDSHYGGDPLPSSESAINEFVESLLKAKPIAELIKDKQRIDWLSDKDNRTGFVMLPDECVEQNIDDMRAAIDMAMEKANESAK